MADYDRDGWLDIYFCLYLYYQGTDQYRYPSPYYDAENGPPNFMMRNQRDGSFRDVTAEAGLDQNNTRYSFCCAWSDYNRDGWPDLYVVNDFGRKNLYRNNGDGTFTDVAPHAGVEDVGAGMSVCWFDHDNDGAEDLYVANMWTAAGKRISTQEIFQKDTPEAARALYRKHAMGNSLFRNNGEGAWVYAIPPDASPQTVDWQRFLGPARDRELQPMRFRNWRYFWDYSGGNMTDQGTHLMDVTQWFTGVKTPVSAISIGALLNVRMPAMVEPIVHAPPHRPAADQLVRLVFGDAAAVHEDHRHAEAAGRSDDAITYYGRAGERAQAQTFTAREDDGPRRPAAAALSVSSPLPWPR